MSCRPVWQTLNIQFRKILYISLDENLVSLLNAVPVVQELGELVIFPRHGSATIRIDTLHDTGIYSVQQLYDIPYVTVNKLR